MSTNSGRRSSITKVVAASFAGTAIEWYDFFLYGTAAALVFPKLFFPSVEPLAGTMASFGTYTVGFLARPFGGLLFGHFGDRIGRRAVLVTTLMMVGLSTFLIGLLPSYDSIGLMAPVLLVTLRFIQGLGVGGEWAGAVLLVVEHGSSRSRGFYASWVQAGAPVGLLLATGAFGLAALLPEGAFLAWGWRVPFLLGIVLTGVGLLIRMHVFESPLFTESLKKEPAVKLPILEVIRSHPRNVLLAMGSRMAENAFYYFFTVFVLSYSTLQLGMARETVLGGIVAGAVAHLVATLLFGALSDRLGRRTVYLGGALFLGLFAYPFFLLIGTKTGVGVWLGITIGLIGHAAMYGPQAAFLAELFGTRVRYTGASLGYQLASPLSGGVAPLIAAALLQWSGNEPWPVAIYLASMAGITLVSVWLATETRHVDLAQDERSILPVSDE